MTVGSIGVQPAPQDITASGLTQKDFLKVLLTQLQFQDPLKPMDNKDFMAQMAQFTALQQASQTNDKMDNLLSIQSADQSLSLLNKTVQVDLSNGSQVGNITTVKFQQGVPVFSIQTSSGQTYNDVSLSQISLVR